MLGLSAPFAPAEYLPTNTTRLVSGHTAPTFQSLGLYLRYEGDANDNSVCRMRFRPAGGAWRQGMELVPVREERAFRGSLLLLQPDTAYEIECTLADPDQPAEQTPLRLAGRTWSEARPIGERRFLPEGVCATSLVITARGRPEAWILIAPPPGRESVIDAGTNTEYAVHFMGAAYVVFDRVTVRGGRLCSVVVENSENVVVRRCDLADWGSAGAVGSDGRQYDRNGRLINYQAGLSLRNCERVLAEHNFIHRPRLSANSWAFGHPAGPQGINQGYGGNNVIRYNDVVGSEDRWWNDAIEGLNNSDIHGGPSHDTDIHGNLLAFSNDDGTELDGGQMNVRYWDNRVEMALCGISCAPCRSGPAYVFGNLVILRGEERGAAGRGFKMGAGRFSFPGLNLLFNNTVVSPAMAMGDGNYGDAPTPLLSRNNLYTGMGAAGGWIDFKSQRPVQDMDFDLLSRQALARIAFPGREAHAVVGNPLFRDRESGDFRLAPGSPGIRSGCPLPGLNEPAGGTAPDIGAFGLGDPDRSELPARPAGLAASPGRVLLNRTAGEPLPSGRIELVVPPSAGTGWTAIANAPWIRCEPASGPASAATQVVAVTVNPDEMDIRLHRGAVTFRTSEGYNRTVMADVKVRGRPFLLYQDAEQAAVTGDFPVCPEATAFGGLYRVAPSNGMGAVSFYFDMTTGGVCFVLGRCRTPAAETGSHNSFAYRMDDEPRQIWDLDDFSDGAWLWAPVTARDRTWPVPRAFNLSPGRHVLTLFTRETMAELDGVALSGSPYPEDMPEPGREGARW